MGSRWYCLLNEGCGEVFETYALKLFARRRTEEGKLLLFPEELSVAMLRWLALLTKEPWLKFGTIRVDERGGGDIVDARPVLFPSSNTSNSFRYRALAAFGGMAVLRCRGDIFSCRTSSRCKEAWEWEEKLFFLLRRVNLMNRNILSSS